VAAPELLHHTVRAPRQLQAEVDAPLVTAPRLATVRVEGDAHGGRLGDDRHLLLAGLEELALPLVLVQRLALAPPLPLVAPVSEPGRPPCQLRYVFGPAEGRDQGVKGVAGEAVADAIEPLDVAGAERGDARDDVAQVVVQEGLLVGVCVVGVCVVSANPGDRSLKGKATP
jgi:hypothetical protein